MYKKTILFLSIAMCVAACSSSSQSSLESSIEEQSVFSSSEIISSKPIELKLEETDEIFDFHTENQGACIESDTHTSAVMYAVGNREYSRPDPLYLEYQTTSAMKGPFYVELADNEEFENSIIYENEDEAFFPIYNLYLNTTYYWRGYTEIDGETIFSKTATFKTEDTYLRNLYVDGVANVRDLGGYPVTGKFDGFVKQGLLYRTGRLNLSSSKTVMNDITPDGIDTMNNILGIKTEIDLRKTRDNEVGSITSSPLGSDVNYVQCPMEFDGSLISLNTTQIKTIFQMFANQSTYPAIFHCNIGTDRTGLIAYLMLGLLGVDLDLINMDYLFSNFAYIGGTRSLNRGDLDDYRGVINGFNKDSLQENVEAYLLSIGITQSEIDNIYQIMISK